ncbi:putative arginine--tRNA ligase, mitochondrial [Trichonephila inaurata madagascariensis]|uniref:Probable arginine--tRNA ligase, mitochondrial n=1 Tax=Trichonephila inaurata madagascariensis TaxID=2747483 RepID=A0A8X6XA39_9ARAC|nr:putative arginine--tRNA ligase, mitochondrial [Trichonephila inaurata madagascariensis]
MNLNESSSSARFGEKFHNVSSTRFYPFWSKSCGRAELVCAHSEARLDCELSSKGFIEKKLIVIQDDGRVKVNVNSDVEGEEHISYNELNSFVFHLSSRIFYLSLQKESDYDVMYHVAPTSEKNSFSLVHRLLKELGYNSSDNFHHIRLKDISHFKRHKKAGAEEIMDQAKVFMLNKLQTDLQIQAVEAVEQMAEILSISSLSIYDMKHRRNVDYDFNWNNILSLGKNSGVSLQMCHAGLKGLQEDADYKFSIEADTSPLSEPAAQHLIKHLARFDEMVYKSYITLEPCIILQYLFSLWYFTDKASNELKMCREFEKNELVVLKARLMLFEATLKILQRGLHLLGVKPFETNYSPPDFVNNETYKNIFNK